MEVPVESRHDGERLSPFSCILVAVDGSNASLEAAQVAVRMASLHQLPVVALYVVDDRTVNEVASISQGAPEVIRRNLEEQGWRCLELVARLAQNYGVEPTRLVRYGVPHIQIASVAREYGVDLIVIGKASQGGARRSQVGRVTERVIEYVPCAVLVVNVPETNDWCR